MASAATYLTVQFLEWLAVRRRTDSEVRNAWSSTCPLNCALEDALSDDLIRRTADGYVVLTEQGKARLGAQDHTRSWPSPDLTPAEGGGVS